MGSMGILRTYVKEKDDPEVDDGSPSAGDVRREEDKKVAAATEMSSIEAFGDFLLDEGRTSFTFEEAEELSEINKNTTAGVIRGLKAYGFTMEERVPERRVRGFRTSSNDRFFGPGADKMHGGSGYENITGMAGQEG